MWPRPTASFVRTGRLLWGSLQRMFASIRPELPSCRCSGTCRALSLGTSRPWQNQLSLRLRTWPRCAHRAARRPIERDDDCTRWDTLDCTPAKIKKFPAHMQSESFSSSLCHHAGVAKTKTVRLLSCGRLPAWRDLGRIAVGSKLCSTFFGGGSPGCRGAMAVRPFAPPAFYVPGARLYWKH